MCVCLGGEHVCGEGGQVFFLPQVCMHWNAGVCVSHMGCMPCRRMCACGCHGRRVCIFLHECNGKVVCALTSWTLNVPLCQAGATLISPFVGRITDWYKASLGVEGFAPEEDPGVKSVQKIYTYFKQQKFPTYVMVREHAFLPSLSPIFMFWTLSFLDTGRQFPKCWADSRAGRL